MDSLLYNWLNALLYRFCSEGFICKDVRIIEMDTAKFRLSAVGYVQVFSRYIHRIHNRCDICIIIIHVSYMCALRACMLTICCYRFIKIQLWRVI